MALALGIDTGGTYTDAVVYDTARNTVRAAAKSLTTHRDLQQGVAGALAAVFSGDAISADDIDLVSVSTTLATNALVEGRIARAGLILIGFPAAVAERPELLRAIGDGPVITIAGGHDAHGQPAQTLDLEALDRALAALPTTPSPATGSRVGETVLEAFAVAGMFAVRNAEHEQAVRARLRDRFGVPVTCSHELSAALDAPRRAVTAVLNAQLVGLIDGLIAAVQTHLGELGIKAPLMIVRGDGALMAASVARERPIETILSGPAASCIGAAHLAGATTAIVSDIGGTTTDIAVLENGVPMLAAAGANVGGWQTMVRAVAMHTVGLGGDSAVTIAQEGLAWSVKLGPQRRLPLSLAALDFEAVILRELRRQLASARPTEHDGLFIVAAGTAPATHDPLVQRLASAKAPVALTQALQSRRELPRIMAAVARGQLRLASVTPSDASHVLGDHSAWCGQAAELGLALLAKRRDARGDAIAPGAAAMATQIVEAVHARSAEEIMNVALSEDSLPRLKTGDTARIYDAALDGHEHHVGLTMALRTPIVAVGASAATYYPAVANRLRTTAIVPDHAGVANAVGAVVSPVRVEVIIEITAPAEGVYRLQDTGGAIEFADQDEAVAAARSAAHSEALARAERAGAIDARVNVEAQISTARVEGGDMFVSATITARASGRPKPRAGTPSDTQTTLD